MGQVSEQSAGQRAVDADADADAEADADADAEADADADAEAHRDPARYDLARWEHCSLEDGRSGRRMQHSAHAPCRGLR